MNRGSFNRFPSEIFSTSDREYNHLLSNWQNSIDNRYALWGIPKSTLKYSPSSSDEILTKAEIKAALYIDNGEQLPLEIEKSLLETFFERAERNKRLLESNKSAVITYSNIKTIMNN
jgi:hypothetical protein